jgi:hypothetical protein
MAAMGPISSITDRINSVTFMISDLPQKTLGLAV